MMRTHHSCPNPALGPSLRAVALAVALAAALPAGFAADPKASQYYEDALQRFEKKDYAGAVIQLKNVLKADNKNLSAQVLLGKALLEKGDVGPAEVAFNEALRLGVNRAEVVVPLARTAIGQAKQRTLLDDPRFELAGLPTRVQYDLLVLKAGAATDLGDRRNAMAAIERARAIDPAKPQSWTAEVNARSRAGEFREALAAADKALSLDPTDAEALYLRGTVSHVQGDLTTALGFYDKALVARPGHTEALVSRAGLLVDRGKAAEAERDLAELAKTSPSDPRGAYLRAVIAERSGHPQEVKKALNEVVGLIDPIPIEFMRYRPQLLMLGGLAHHGLNQREKARPYLEAVLHTQPASPVAKLLGQIYLDERNTDRAVEVLDTYLRAHPSDAQAVMLAASAQMALGRYARATGMLQSAIQQTDLPEFRSSLGLSLMGAGRPKAALPELEAAFRKDPGQIHAGTALASLYLQAGNASKAVTVAQTLVRNRPSQPGLLHLLGTAQLRAGDIEAARKTLGQAAALDANFMAPVVELARLEITTGALDKAVARLNGILEKDPKNLDALTMIGQLQARLGNQSEARKWLEKADIQSGLGQLEPGLRLVEFDLAQRRPDLAQSSLKRLLDKAPGALPVLVMQARVHLANADAVSARSVLGRASSIAGAEASALAAIAALQLAAGHPEGARHSLSKALADEPGHLRGQVLMARIELLAGELANAEQRARKLTTSHPKEGVGPSLLGEIALARGNKSAALEAFHKAHRLDQTTNSLLRLHQALLASDSAGAQKLGETWLKSHPQDMAVHRAIGDAYVRQGQLSKARAAYEALTKVYPDDADALNNLANVLIAMKDAGASEVAERALVLKPQIPYIVGTAGWAAFHAGQLERALLLLRDAKLRDPGNSETRYFLGAALAKSGRNAEAREELQAALSNKATLVSAKEAEQLLLSLK